MHEMIAVTWNIQCFFLLQPNEKFDIMENYHTDPGLIVRMPI